MGHICSERSCTLFKENWDFLLKGLEKEDVDRSWEQLSVEQKAKWYPRIFSACDPPLDYIPQQSILFLGVRMHLFVSIQHGGICLHSMTSKKNIDHCDLFNMFLYFILDKRFQISLLMWWKILNWKTLILFFHINSSSICRVGTREEMLMVTLAISLWPLSRLEF